MILYHPNGTAFVLSPAIWRSALQLAVSSGWQPDGTLPPPSDLERPPAQWSGAYEPAAGQQVTRPDAMALAAALNQALGEDPHARHELRLLAGFCRSGGFLICASPGISDSLASLVEHVGTGVPIPSAPAPAQPAPQRPDSGQGTPSLQ
ncbi:MAG: hypothetical protein ACOYX1_18300 [Acidobacteriota bacterium]